MDSLSRLKRPIVGQRLHEPRPVVERAEARSRIQPPAIEIPDHTRDTEVRIRSNRRQADPSPNAPQLVRLNRNPFPLHRGSFERTPLVTMSLARPERASVTKLVDAARAAYIKPTAGPRPTDLHLRPQPRQRPSVAAWLDGRGADDE